MIIRQLISTVICILIGWLLIDKVSKWIGVKGSTASIIKIIGVIIILGSLATWIQ